GVERDLAPVVDEEDVARAAHPEDPLIELERAVVEERRDLGPLAAQRVEHVGVGVEREDEDEVGPEPPGPEQRELLPERLAEETVGTVRVDREHLVTAVLHAATHVERDPAPLVSLGEEDDPHAAKGS